MPMVILDKEWEYGGEIRQPGQRLTVSKSLEQLLLREKIAHRFGGDATGEVAAPVAGVEREVPRPAVAKPKFRRCGGCGW